MNKKLILHTLMNKKLIIGLSLLILILAIFILVGYSSKTKIGDTCTSNETCQIGDTCTSNETCQNIDCSSYDTPVKEGYKPFCVDNQCRCMCYSCK